MTTDPTQRQSDYQQKHSSELSRQRSRPPLEVSGYEARQFLGAGAYGEVWVAVDQNTGRRVAIKFYTQRSSVDWSLLSREVEKLVFLSADRYVVQLLDVGWNADPPYYVMEYVEGGSLQQRLDREGRLQVGEAVEMFREVATGLMHAHGKGVLHCDLKPANILLDQDHKPRLADFGQSRLSHEQTPALGTLFFMAPEQADLKAVPDARWDVYALGALLYCMLTGQPPYRSEDLLSEIDSAPSLAGRLGRYRQEIINSPRPADHRQIASVDRELADIVDRCLHIDMDQRFPNVQSVLTALRRRDAMKDRRPLLLLGLLGPLLFLLILGLFSWRASQQSFDDSDVVLKTWALESSRFAAKFVSEAVARRIDGYFRLVEEQAQDETLRDRLAGVSANDALQKMLEQLVDDRMSDQEGKAIRQRFLDHPARQQLQRHFDELVDRSGQEVASWFVTDRHGVQLASAFSEPVERSSIGQDYSFRTYFHGGRQDLSKEEHHVVSPLQNTQLSTVFRSTASDTWKIAVSTPVVVEGETIGVVALTVELGRLGDDKEFSASEDRFVVLVDGREGSDRGVILQHPLFNEILSDANELPDGINRVRVPLDELPRANVSQDGQRGPPEAETISLYRDPIAELAEGEAYDRNWIAARQEVLLESNGVGDQVFDTGLVVLVQEDYDSAVTPLRNLKKDVLQDGVLALLLIVAVLILLWYFVTRTLRDPDETLRRLGGSTRRHSSLYSMDTLELPDQLRELPRDP